ncbi:DUF4352 domain-containing protein [Halobacterium wangiae]|uniref:DUF4352 domain-containing protein n=1 Tax=Halobacterium wangiae TaxID=2902623 RepID=UPI001E37AFD8|nr:DUF4352 domain-containing protein [Halobacterium wangiae]
MSTETVATTTEHSTTTASAPRAATVSTGDTVGNDKLQFVLEEFQRDVDLEGFSEPDSGQEFALASIMLQNMSTEDPISGPHFLTRLRDDEYYTYEPLIADNNDSYFSEDQLGPGSVVRASIPFELPVTASGLKLLFDVDEALFGGVTLIIVDL